MYMQFNLSLIYVHEVLCYSIYTAADFEQKARHWTLPRPTRLHHVVEDFLTRWVTYETHVIPLRRFLEDCTATVLIDFTADECMEHSLTGIHVPVDCSENYLIFP